MSPPLQRVSYRCTIGVQLFALLAFLASSLASSAQADLPDEAQGDFAKGVTAAAVGDFDRAAEHFRSARRVAPESPVLHYNLGLAEAQIAGHELPAQCWLATYLAGNPTSSLRPSIEAQLESLEVDRKQNIKTLIELYESVGLLRPQLREDNHDYFFFRLGTFWLHVGDIDRAKAAAARMKTVSNRLAELQTFIERKYAGLFDVNIPTDLFNVPYESNDTLNRLSRWVLPNSKRTREASVARAEAWSNICDNPTLTQAQHADTLGYLEQVAGTLGEGTDFEKAHRLVPRLEGIIKEVMTMGNVQQFYVRDLLALIEPPLPLVYTLAFVLAAYVLAILLILFDILFRGAKTVATEVPLGTFFKALALTPLGIILMLYASISLMASTPATVPTAWQGWIGLIIGGGISIFFLITFFGLTIYGLVIIFVKLSGASQAIAVQEVARRAR